jgi:hypothetical protein
MTAKVAKAAKEEAAPRTSGCAGSLESSPQVS